MTKKEHAMDYIMQLIDSGDPHCASKAAETLSVARSTIYNYISQMITDNIIEKDSNGKYRLVSHNQTFLYENKNLREENIFNRDILPHLRSLPQNVISVWRYAFTEMMNNAIDHSQAENITIYLKQNRLNTTINICDDGVGIFEKIREYMLREHGEELTHEECMGLLFAGKFTTAKEYHSGEGIFFTSHLMDLFYILSDKLFFTRNNFSECYLNADGCTSGTVVCMVLSNKSHKTPKEVFDRYTNSDNGFSKTNIPIAHMFTDGYPVSRSEARRLGEMLSRFSVAILDFSGVASIGQAFTHELFVVWQKRHPDITLETKDVAPDVENMIKRVLHDAEAQ